MSEFSHNFIFIFHCYFLCFLIYCFFFFIMFLSVISFLCHVINTCEPSDYASLKLMSFKHIHEYFSLIRFFKYYKLNESLNFKTKIENHQTNHSYNTRHSMARKLNCPNLRLSKLKTSFLYNSIKFWNKIPSDIKSAQNLNLFKKYLKESHIYEPNW